MAPQPAAHIEALDAVVAVLSELQDGAADDAFYDRLCAAVCRLAAMERAIIFRYDGARRRVRAAGAHGMDLTRFAEGHVSVETAPVTRRALAEDAVLEVAPGDPGRDVPGEYAGLLRDAPLVCTPMAAAGRWIGVILSDRAPGAPALTEGERDLLWTLGKTAALASVAHIATVQREKARALEQRIDLAREIHERVIQRLFGVSLALAVDGGLAPAARERCAGELQAALADLRTAVQRPLGRTARPSRTTLAEELDRLARAHPDLGVVLEQGPADVPAELEPLAQSVLAEAVRNAHKHARPTRVGVRVGRADGAFVLEVVNDGVRAGARRRTGMGLRLAGLEALQEGGVVEFGPRAPGAWQVRLVVPIDGD